MTNQKKMLDREAVRSVIRQWNANRLDLFALSEPDENLLFHGVMRFYFQDAGQKVATKCIRVASDATVTDVIDTLIEKFRPDMRMLSVPNYALYEVHSNGEERKLNPDEKPLLVQLNWHIDDREGRFLLKNIDQKTTPIETSGMNFKRKLSKRERKEQKKKDKQAKTYLDPTGGVDNETHVAGKLYTELPDTSFTRSISNPEAVMRRRRQQKLEKKLQQFRSRDGGPDTGGTLKIYGESLCQDVPYKTLLLSIRDFAQAVVREMLAKYGLDKADPLHYCLVQVNCDGTEYILDDDECPLSILMNHPTSRGSIMFHVRRRPADSQPRRRKKKPLGVSNGANNSCGDREVPVLVEVTHSGDGGRRIRLGSDPIEVGSANTNSLQLFGPSIQARHCLISLLEGICTVTPLHADALTFVNGHHITQPTILHNGSVVMFGRVASYRFLDSPSDGRYNLALSQSQLDSACLYESRSPISPASWNDDNGISLNKNADLEATNTRNPISSGIIANETLHLSEDNKKPLSYRPNEEHLHVHTKEPEINSESAEANLEKSETKSITSLKSSGSTNQDLRSQKTVAALENQGQEPILPAVLEFPETHQDNFLCRIVTELDVNVPHFKLAPVYTLYLCARYRASTHYRPELQPTERAHKLTIFLHHVANLIYSVVQEQYADPRVLAFWIANSSEFLHFLKSDRHISAFSVQAQEILAESVQTAFRNLVNCFRVELSQTLNQFLSETIDHDSAAGLVLTVLGSAMALLRRCRVNAALTIQLFSQLFHYINVICFNTIVANSHMCTAEWGKVLTDRLQLLELWAERQGLELAADCHLAKINQCAQFLQASKTSVEEIQKLACSCFRLNSLQMTALLQQEKIPRSLIDTVIRMAESVADELTRSDGREVRLEESPELHLALLLPDDGFSCDVVRGIPSGLVDFLNPLQSAGMCRLAAQPTSIGLWTVYMHQFNARSSSAMSNKLPQPEVQVIKLLKNSNGMGLSIVAAKGAGQERLGIYIKSVVPGGAADADSRLQAGDQLLRVDGQSLIGITQERAADYLVRTGPVVTLEVAKQGAIYHGLATLLQQPSPINQRGGRIHSDRDLFILGTEPKIGGPLTVNSHLTNSKSVPALHHSSNNVLTDKSNSKSRSTHSLANNNEQGFYQNLSVYRAQNQSQPMSGERSQIESSHSAMNTYCGNFPTPNTASEIMQQKSISTNKNNILNRPASAYYQNNINGSHGIIGSNMPFNDNNENSTSSTNISSNENSPSQLHHVQHQSAHTMGTRSKVNHTFNRDGQNHTSLRKNQIFAPSMPNIAGDHTASASPVVHNSVMLTSQSMQNVNLITHHGETQQQHGFANVSNNYNPQYITKPPSSNPMVSGRTQHVIENLPKRKTHRTDLLQDNSYINQMMSAGNTQPPHQHREQHANAAPLPPKPQGLMHDSSGQAEISSKHQVRSIVPKSQPSRVLQKTQPHNAEETPPLPPTTTHPLFKNNTQTSQQGLSYVASTLDPPKRAYFSTTAPTAHHTSYSVANPWEREEREREHEMRREHVRHWRDQQIAELSTLSQRSPQQEEQLKTLVLERDFEKRAHEVEEQGDESETSFEKESFQEFVRLVTQPSSIQTPTTNFRQADIKTEQEESKEPEVNLVQISDSHALNPHNFQIQQSQTSTTILPKGILKNNRNDSSVTSSAVPSSPSKSQKSASFADERHFQTEQNISCLAKDVSHMDLNPEINANNMEQLTNNSMSSGSVPPPPPPERNSSYIIMSQQQQKLRNSAPLLSKTTPSPSEMLDSTTMPMYFNGGSNKKTSSILYNTNNNNHPLKNTLSMNEIQFPLSSYSSVNVSNNSLTLGRDNKRVSFHDEENNYVPPQTTPFTNKQGYTNDQPELHTISENMNEFSPRTTELLQTPTTPEADVWNSIMQSTPGVIGAQEVYKDPRQRRLAEQQQKQQQRTGDAVPEKLSFKEKMKMFALESGEDQTPKDKLKISRAQRDIDAVH